MNSLRALGAPIPFVFTPTLDAQTFICFVLNHFPQLAPRFSRYKLKASGNVHAYNWKQKYLV